MNVFSRRIGVALALLLSSSLAQAAFHLWDISEVYSNADGSVLFIELFCPVDGQQFLLNHELNASSDGNVVQFVFPGNSGSPTMNQSLLLATPGFDALPGGVTPDFILPAGFFDPSADSISLDFGPGQDVFNFTRAQLPSNGRHSLNRDLSTNINSPTNFAGATGEVSDNLVYLDGVEALCPLAFPDGDNDTYGDSTSNGVEMCNLQAGFVRNADDCYDQNLNAHPAQTQYFTVDRGDGSYDYNCSTVPEQEFTQIGMCDFPPACGVTQSGWLNSPAPDCGQTGPLLDDCQLEIMSGICDLVAGPNQTQACR